MSIKLYIKDISMLEKIRISDKSVGWERSEGHPTLCSSYAFLSQDDNDHCHYQGIIRGMKDSRVVLNTCNGLR